MGGPLVQLTVYNNEIVNAVIGVAVDVAADGKPFYIRFLRLAHLGPSLEDLKNQLIEDTNKSGR